MQRPGRSVSVGRSVIVHAERSDCPRWRRHRDMGESAQLSHRNTLNQLTEGSAGRDTWEEAVADLHQALQIVGVVLDELEKRVRTLESAQGIERRS